MEKADKVLRIEKIKQIERNKNGSSKSNGTIYLFITYIWIVKMDKKRF